MHLLKAIDLSGRGSANHTPLTKKYPAYYRSKFVGLVICMAVLLIAFLLPLSDTSVRGDSGGDHSPPQWRSPITVNPTSLSFTAEQGGNNPDSQSVAVESDSDITMMGITTSSLWLEAVPTAFGSEYVVSHSLGINVSVNAQGLSVGSYAGFVTVALKEDMNGTTAAVRGVAVKLTVIPSSVASPLLKTLLEDIAKAEGEKQPP